MKKNSPKASTRLVNGEPDWLHDNPEKESIEYSANDYERFADGFIRSNSDLPMIKKLIRKLGTKILKEKIIEAFKRKMKLDEILKELN